MIYAVKNNKCYQVGEDAAQQEDFLSRGYDLTDETGKIIRHSPVKTVPYAKYAALLEENEQLKAQLADAPKGRK